MNSFQQVCPQCQSTLQLPVEADGKAAICPACRTEFVASVSVEEPPAAVSDPLTPDPSAPVPEPRVRTARAPQQSQVVEYRSVSIESILGDTQTVFIDRRRPLLLPFLIPSVLILCGLVFPLAYLSELVSSNRTKGLVWTAGATPWFLLVATYSFWFALNLAVDVCDAGPDADEKRPERIRSWFIPDLGIFVVLLVLVTALTTILGILIAASMSIMNATSRVEAIELRILSSLIAFGGTVVGLTLIAMRFWPLIPMALDGRFGTASPRSSPIKQALAITSSNLMTSFLLVVALFFLLGLGFSLFGIGLPIAIPLAALTLVIALRLIEGKRIPAFEREEI